ncbi:MAG: DegV family protein [Deltaproteobacteria bacterium]|nr:DegV family protein [Deltaproteobacteria bacterium]
MQKVAIVADSVACLTREMVEQYGITIAPIPISFQGKIYRDWVDITPSEAYELFLKDPDSFKTAGASPGIFLEAYRQASKRAKNILCVTLSVKLSGAYDAARQAIEEARKELPQISVEVVDSKTVTASEGFVALAGARAAEAGKSLAEVVKAAEEMRERVTFLALLETIRHVYRTGRIPKIAAMAGSVLRIKPILTSSGGVVRFMGAVRSRAHGIDKMLKIMRNRVGQSPAHVAVMHAYAPDEAEKLKERVSAEFNCAELWLTEFSPVMGYATGTGTLGLAFYKED